MNPEQLAKSGTEHAEQCALFCWANMAVKYGFPAANNMANYRDPVPAYGFEPVPSLRWLHAIPNAGARGNKVAASQLKAEGVKAGVADVFLPSSVWIGEAKPSKSFLCGLYIELKREDGVPSDISKEQIEFAAHVTEQNYAWAVAFGWKQAAALITAYIKCETPTLTPKQAQVLQRVAAASKA